MARYQDQGSKRPHISEDDRASEPSESTRLLDGNESGVDDEDAKSVQWEGHAEYEGLPWWRKPTIFWLMLPYSVFALAFGGMIVPKVNLILGLVCNRHFAEQEILNPDLKMIPIDIGGDNPQCRESEVMSKVSLFMLGITLSTGILSAFVVPKIGHLSDRHGRMKLMACASMGGVVNEAITILAAKFPNTIDYRWLILGAMFDGAAGSFTSGMILTQSYTSDCTPPSKRAVAIGFIYSCLFTGLALGPLLSGYIVKWTGSILAVFYIALGCHVFFVLMAAFIIPESLSKRRQLAAREKYDRELEMEQQNEQPLWWYSLVTSNPALPLKRLWPQGPGTSLPLRVNLVVLAMTDFVVMGCTMGAGAVVMLYAEKVFGWGTFETSKYVSAVSMVRVVVLLGIFPAINHIFRVLPARRQRRKTGIAIVEKHDGADRMDIWVLRVALFSDLLGAVGFIFAKREEVFYVSGMMTALGGLGSATVQTMVTKHIPADRIGQVLGAMGMTQALARVVCPILFNGLFAKTVGKFNAAIFVLLASLYGWSFIASFVLRSKVYWDEGSTDLSDPNEEQQNQNEALLAEEQALAGTRA